MVVLTHKAIANHYISDKKISKDKQTKITSCT